MSKRILKMASLILALTLLTSQFAGCGTKKDDTASTSTQAVTSESTTAEASNSSDGALEYIEAAKTPVELTMFINDVNFDDKTWGKEEISKWIIEKTGVNLKIEKPVSADDQKITLMMATNSLPDLVFFGDKMNAALGKMIQQDMVYDLDELIDKHAPNFRNVSMYANNADVYKWEQGGKLYFIPGFAADRGNANKEGKFYMAAETGNYVRKDILAELGNPEITSLEKAIEVAKQAKEKHPELTNVIQLWDALSYDYNASGINILYRMFGGGFKYIKKDGKLVSMMRDPLYQKTLLYVNHLIKDGLVNMNNITDTSGKSSDAANNKGSLFWSAGPGWRILGGMDALRKENSKIEYTGIKHFTAEGVEHFYNPGLNINGWAALVITKKSANPDRAIKFLEFLSTPEAQQSVCNGLEGIDWQWGGPKNNLCVPIGQAKDLIKKSYADFQKVTGANKYRWIGSLSEDTAAALGQSVDDPLRSNIFTIETEANDDSSEFAGIDPTPGTDEYLINSKINPIWKSYIGKIALAKTDDEANKLYTEFVAKVDSLGMPKLEEFWTTKYNELQDIIKK